MFGKKNVKIDKEIYLQIEKIAENKGIKDLNIFIETILKEYISNYNTVDNDKIRTQLEKLGYV